MSADKVTRYDPQLHGTDHRVHIVMEPDDTGDYVLHWDYETLAARLAVVDAERDWLRDDKARLDWLLHACTHASNPEMKLTVHWGLSNAGRSTIDRAKAEKEGA